MIVKNEEKHLERCLLTASGVFDEIIIVDTGSTDKTKEIAREFTDKIYDFEWIDDFSAARNFAFSKATSEYVMWLDADDIIPENTRKGIIILKEQVKSDVDVIRLPYHTGYDGDGNVTYSFYRERIIKNCEQAKFAGFIHEVIEPFGKIMNFDLPVEHRKIHGNERGRNLRIYEKHLAAGEDFTPRDVFYYARELYYHNRNNDAAKAFTKFLAEGKGWTPNNIEACKIRAECYERLRERKNAYMSLYASFYYGLPGAEVCCELGRMLFEDALYKQAIFWYKTAYEQEPDFQSGAFVLPDCYGYIPALQICVCYSRLGDEETAGEWNEKAAVYKVTDAITYNRNYFNGLKTPYKLVKYK
jgi:glycosyltransferase involved in cell wall biosynthesis